MSQTVHCQQWRVSCFIPVIIDKRGPGHRGTGFRLDRININFFSVNLVVNVWIGNTCKIASTSRTSNNHIRIFTNFFKLFLRFKTNNGLVEHYMIQHTTQGITGFSGFIRNCSFYSFTNCNTQTTGSIRILFQYIPACLCCITGA